MMLFLDACALIYRFEGATAFQEAVTHLVAEVTAGQAQVDVAVSRLSVLECKVKPLREGNLALLRQYDDFFSVVKLIELDANVVDLATDIRVRFGLKTPDALQAASALVWHSDVVFVTADTAFAKMASLDVRLLRYPSE